MPLNPPVAEDLLALLDKYTDLTPTQKAILKSAAAYLVEDTLALTDDSLFIHPEPRLRMNVEEYRLLPDRIELINGVLSTGRRRIYWRRRHESTLNLERARLFLPRFRHWREGSTDMSPARRPIPAGVPAMIEHPDRLHLRFARLSFSLAIATAVTTRRIRQLCQLERTAVDPWNSSGLLQRVRHSTRAVVVEVAPKLSRT